MGVLKRFVLTACRFANNNQQFPTLVQACRRISAESSTDLKGVMVEKISKHTALVKEFRSKYGKTPVGEVTVDMMYGGMRGIPALVTETSLLDAAEGVRFRNYSIHECQELLPKQEGGTEPIPEGLFWLLMTGDIPTKAQADSLSKSWAERAELPPHIVTMLNNFCGLSIHPMTQLSCAVTALNTESKFAKAYSEGVKKALYWEFTYEDSMDLISKLPLLAASIYRNTYKEDKDIGTIDPNCDWTANFTKMLGSEFQGNEFTEAMRLYLTLHSDHEGGNVSAHATHLVGSALSDPYLSLGAGLNGLAGPLHGLANQEVLVFLLKVQEELGDNVSDEKLKEFVLKTLKAGQVIPGFGHAVLRKTDPRYIRLREFALKKLPDDPMFKLVSQMFTIVPPILQDTGKVRNPWPNVDAHSGVLLQYYGLKEMNYYTVLFGISRALGALASLIWDRALGFPLERPKSYTTESLKKLVKAV